MAIEDLLREAAAKGLTHLTLYPVDSNDGKSTYWNARATPSTMHSYVQTANKDPAEAVRVVLEALPRAPRRKPKSDKQLTAAVTEPVVFTPEENAMKVTNGDMPEDWFNK